MAAMRIRIAAIGLLALALAGCMSGPDYSSDPLPLERGRSLARGPQTGGKTMQCVPFARDNSGVKLSGDATTWWDQADGRYPRSSEPSNGAVMVLNNYAGPDHGHLAVVRTVVSAREIRVDHANWMDDGAVYLDDPVADVSADNDWSAVKVFNLRAGAWGVRIYPVQGFIGPAGNPRKPRGGGSDRVAGLDGSDARSGTRNVSVAPE